MFDLFNCSLREELQKEKELLEKSVELHQDLIIDATPVRISEILCRHVKNSKDAICAKSDIKSLGMGAFECICLEELSWLLIKIMSAYEHDSIQKKIIQTIKGEMLND